MSLTYTLRRLIDPSFDTASEQAQMERVLEQAPAPVPGDGAPIKLFQIVLGKRTRACRLCGRKGEGDTFCLTCLADTME